ncbi:MAG TPA: hypothetical protein VMZ27_04155, partial [Candidatus Saccharimonadales bacterium]|nr:hypothetical protein [Candidatus Saccharimonadales bacterium]
MKTTFQRLLRQIPILGLLCAATVAHAQPVGQWDFNSGNLSPTVGTAITYADGPAGATATGTQFGTTASFGISSVNGTNASVMKFQGWNAGKGYRMPTPPNPNGGALASQANTYTLIMDVLYPSDSSFKIRPLLQSDDGTLSGGSGYLLISTNNGVGAFGKGNGSFDGPYYATLQSNTWYRLGFVVSGAELKVHIYVNGSEVGNVSRAEIDDRFSLFPADTALILANGVNGKTNSAGVLEAATGYVNSIQLRDVALNPGQMAALGGPAAPGIPTVIPTVPSFISSRTPAINETGVSPSPAIKVELSSGDAVVTTSSLKLYMDGTVLPASVVSGAGGLITISYTIPTILDQISTHLLALTYTDTVSGNQSNSWSFTVANYQNVFLPAPIYLETFDSTAEGGIPAGWSVTN